MSTCGYQYNSITHEYDYKCDIVDECCTGCGFIGAFTIDGECFHQSGISSDSVYSFWESDKSEENDPDAESSYISSNQEGTNSRFNLYRSVGDGREKCVSRGYISDFESLLDINESGWDCSDYTGTGDRDPTVSCGCWVESPSISDADIVRIVIGASSFVTIVGAILAICFKICCRNNSDKVIINSLQDEEIMASV